ncbi:uncharacterized protein s-cup isoform X1 [Centruroides vittatus]|uniref:uncharacterized protein s-cup isoform X1 n=1 Tax=Centruroides vittatus TaxID=120091 RepID=UPI003510BBCF
MGSGKLADRHAVGSVNIPLAWAMFGGSTFLLFLLCYCCQKKLREDTISLDDSERIRDHSHLQQIHVISTSSLTAQTYHVIPGTPSPPPAYDSVVKKDPYEYEQSPPPYDVALANLRSGGYV